MTPVELSNPIYHDEDAARAHLQAVRWPDGPICPHCGVVNEGIRPLLGESMGPGWYYCTSCKDKFTVRMGTVYERSHLPLHKWLLAFRLLASSKKGFSAHQLSRTLNVTYKTAWFVAHRIREAMADHDPEPFGGKGRVVEVDEMFQGPSNDVFVSGKGWQKKRGTGSKRKIISLIERGGRAKSVKVADLTLPTIKKVLFNNIILDSTLNTDEAQHYKEPWKEFAQHSSVNHSKGEYSVATFAQILQKVSFQYSKEAWLACINIAGSNICSGIYTNLISGIPIGQGSASKTASGQPSLSRAQTANG